MPIAYSGKDAVKLAILGTRGIPAQYGGFETFAEEIAVRLVKQGVDVTVFCEAEKGEQSGEYQGVKLIYVSVPKLGSLTTILFDLICLWRARKEFHVVYMLGYGASPFCFIPRLWGRQVWINMDGVEWARSKWSWLARIWFKMMEAVAMWTPDRIIADAGAIKNHLGQRYRRMPPCSVIPYGATVVETPPSSTLLAEWGVEQNAYYLVVCRLEPENHVREIIEGYSASTSEFPLIVVGNHLSGTEYVQSLVALGNNRVCFVGTIYNQEKLRALRCYARAYFHGHSVGGTNPSLLEAMGCGNVIIAHDNPFNREVAGEAACYFKHAQEIPALLVQLNKDMACMSRMGQVAKDIVAKRYTWEGVILSYCCLLSGDV